jgi:glycosyltransferase involved in cell wall biosynthesis
LEKQKKVLILMPHLSLPGGVTNYYRILQLSQNPNISYFFINSGKHQTLVGTCIRLIVRYATFIYTTVSGKYAIVHLNPSLDYKSFYRDSFFIILSRLMRRKTLVFFRGWLDDYEKKIKESKVKKYLFKISYAKADKYIILSPSFKKKLIDLGVPRKTEFFIETTVADSNFLSEFNIEEKFVNYDKKINILFLATILKEKGIYIAINSFHEFLKKFPKKSATLIVAGEGPELLKVKKYVEDEKISNIIFTGHVSGEMKKKILFKSHILILPSHSEGMPNAILEGMLYGMPVIARITGGIPDVVEQNVNGFLTDSLHCDDFTNYLSILANDYEKYKKMAINNNQIALEKYSTAKVRERILKIYTTFND